ncbi:MAG: Ig-like domain-containing domain [Bacteroidota bacterium]
MKKNRVFTGVSIILFIILISEILVLTTGCANIIPPLGGPRDSLPPNVINIKPADSSKNFKDGRIVFSFDEYVEIQDVQKNLIVSPTPKVAPAVDRKLNIITVKLKDTLEPNTTYTLNFGNSIKDLNEGNILKNFVYIFSTGDYFDSLQLSGKIFLAKTGGVDTTLTAILHRNLDDSAIVKEKPRYTSKVDANGNFKFRNLPSGTFALYAMKDEGSSFRFSGRDQLFAFADKHVTIGEGSDTAAITLYAFPDNEGASTAAAPKARPQASKEKRLIITNNLQSLQQDLLKDLILNFDTPLKTFDTTKIVFATDSSFTPVTGYSFIKDSTNKSVTIKTTWKEGTAYHLILDKDFAVDTLGKKLLKSDTISFKTKSFSDYGALRITFPKIDMSKNPVLFIFQGDQPVDSAVLTTTEFYRKVYNPGEYQLRILYDNNKNGKWDPGQFFGERKQPELIKTIDTKVTVKPNFENAFDRDVNAPPSKNNSQQPTPPAGPKRVNNGGAAAPANRPNNQ